MRRFDEDHEVPNSGLRPPPTRHNAPTATFIDPANLLKLLPSWALIGDAAGLTDPITGEGIYHAFRSAQILADTIERPQEYANRTWNDLGKDLARASHMYRRFYKGSFLGGDFKKRTIQISERSRTLKVILGNLIAGNQSYIGLKKKLFFSMPRISWDVLTGKN